MAMLLAAIINIAGPTNSAQQTGNIRQFWFCVYGGHQPISCSRISYSYRQANNLSWDKLSKAQPRPTYVEPQDSHTVDSVGILLRSLAPRNYSHWLSYCVVCMMLRLAVLVQYSRVTNRQTDTWRQHNTALEQRDMVKTSHVTLATPNRSSLSHLIYSTSTQNMASFAWAVLETWLQASKLKMGRVTPTMNLLRQKLGFDTVYMCTKFNDSSFLAVPEISSGAPKFKVGHVTLTTPL